MEVVYGNRVNYFQTQLIIFFFFPGNCEVEWPYEWSLVPPGKCKAYVAPNLETVNLSGLQVSVECFTVAVRVRTYVRWVTNR